MLLRPKTLRVANLSDTVPPDLSFLFSPALHTGNGGAQSVVNGVNLSANEGALFIKGRSGATAGRIFNTLSGSTFETLTTATTMPAINADTVTSFNTDGFTLGADTGTNNNTVTYISWALRSAANFFDVVAYSGTAATRTVTHQLGCTPGMIIFVKKNATDHRFVFHRAAGVFSFGGFDWTKSLYLYTNAATLSATLAIKQSEFNGTASVEVTNDNSWLSAAATDYDAYFFAHNPTAGIACGSYTGTGAALDVNCGLASAPRGLIIKRADSTGDWYMWDSVRGIVAGNDPFVLINSTAAENSGTDYIDPYSLGFTVTAAAPAALNALGGLYVYVAIA